MPLIHIVRHGRVTDTPEDPRDPALDATGQAQAEAATQELQRRLSVPQRILCSPLRRCRETAAPLLRAWGAEPVVEPRVIEVPSPCNEALGRDEWIRHVLAGDWDGAAAFGERYEAGFAGFLGQWRRDVLQAVLDCAADTVIFSHFIPINVLVGYATGTDKVMSFRPANGSISVFETSGDAIRLVELGKEVDSRVV